jgi:hypothetical protein
VCVTEDDEQETTPMYVACNLKYIRIDEFNALKFDTIKPKLFVHQPMGNVDRSIDHRRRRHVR